MSYFINIFQNGINIQKFCHPSSVKKLKIEPAINNTFVSINYGHGVFIIQGFRKRYGKLYKVFNNRKSRRKYFDISPDIPSNNNTQTNNFIMILNMIFYP